MEWLKKHREIIAAIAVGIPVLYWLYQNYQANQAASGTSRDRCTESANADALASAQQYGPDAEYGGYYSGSVRWFWKFQWIDVNRTTCD